MVFFGGSLGARRINQAVVGLEADWQNRDDRSIYHIVGRRDWAACPSVGQPPDGGRRVETPLAAVRVPYEERMDEVYGAADLVVCRAGAMTVAELAVAGVPSVLVPLPGAPGDHQTANARPARGWPSTLAAGAWRASRTWRWRWEGAFRPSVAPVPLARPRVSGPGRR